MKLLIKKILFTPLSQHASSQAIDAFYNVSWIKKNITENIIDKTLEVYSTKLNNTIDNSKESKWISMIT